MANETPNAKKKAGRPKKQPAPPALGIAERSGPWGKCVIVLGGLVVNGKRYDPQAGADILAMMLEDGMKRIAPAPSPDPAMAAAIAEMGDEGLVIEADGIASPEPASAAEPNGNH